MNTQWTCRFIVSLCFFVMAAVSTMALADVPLSSPEKLKVVDTPSDGGEALTVTWAPSSYDGPDVRYQILLVEVPAGGPEAASSTMKTVAEFAANTHYGRESRKPWWTKSTPPEFHLYELKNGKGVELKDGRVYAVVVGVVRGTERIESHSVQGVPEPNWVNWNQFNNLVLVLGFGGVLLWAIQIAKRKDIFLRRIPGLDAVDEAIGRATELGKPILYLTGAGDMGEPSTIAASVILGRVVKRIALYETDLMVPHRDPITMAVCQEITKQAYMEAGKPDAFKEDSNFYITSDQFSYTAAVDGIMLRKKPAANFFMGSYFAEALLLTETGASTGAIQIAGSDSDAQLPFFVTTCDYTLIGEELYAASAYLSKEPVQVGTLLGQDIGKAVILVVILLGSMAATAGVVFGTDVSAYLLDFFRDMK